MTDLLPEHPEDRAAGAPAGRALAVMALALVLAALFNSGAFVAAAEGMPFGWQRTALLDLAKPVDAVARALRFDRPRAAADRALGRAADPKPGRGAFADPLPSPSAAPPASPSPPPPAVRRDANAAAPLRLFVTGDSMIEFMAPKLIAAGGAAVTGSSEVKYGTGLVRDDFFDWPAHARALLAARQPEAVVVQLGGNDGQNIQLTGRRILAAGSPEWTAEYQRRATVLMQILTGSGERGVYWVGMPPAKSARLFRIYGALNRALAAAAAAVPGARYVDIWDDFAPAGRYTDFLPVNGRAVLVRARDGIHVNREGAALIQRKLLAVLDADWKLRS